MRGDDLLGARVIEAHLDPGRRPRTDIEHLAWAELDVPNTHSLVKPFLRIIAVAYIDIASAALAFERKGVLRVMKCGCTARI